MLKKLLFISICLSLFFTSYAQLVNLNPDPEGEPWYAGKLRELTSSDYAMLSALPQWKPAHSMQKSTLPSSVDNSVLPWFRPIFVQDGGSCGQASGIGYNFTYEIDYLRQEPANIPSNQYPTHFTWNFLNGGTGGGSWYFDGWTILRELGCPTVQEYGGMSTGGQTRWMSEYSKYYNAMFNRTLNFYAINVIDFDGLENLKEWLFSRDGGVSAGGLANFAAGITNAVVSALPAGTPNEGMSVVTKWGISVDHALTIVGFNDSVRYDFNNDGLFTTDLDINNDGAVDLRDCEVGALIVANSWGTSWGNSGKAYMMYKLLAEPTTQGGIWTNSVHLVEAKPDAMPLITIKASLKHTSRNKIKILAGVSQDTNSVVPQFSKQFPMFNFQGGDFFMSGGITETDKTIEFGLDITDLLSYIEPSQPCRFFLQVVENDIDSVSSGEIPAFSVIDYTSEPSETACVFQNVPILNNDTTTLWVNKTINFSKVAIIDEILEPAYINEEYNQWLSAEGGVPPYTWSIDFSYTQQQMTVDYPQTLSGQLQPTSNDDGFAILPLDFEFPFYGNYYNQLTVLTDGAITFNNNFNYIRNATAIMSIQSIAAYCADLMIYPQYGDGIFYEKDSTHVTIRWVISKYNEPSFDADFAVTLFKDGKILFQYGNPFSISVDWGSGISDGKEGSYVITDISGLSQIPSDYSVLLTGIPFPYGMRISSDGLFYGIPIENNVTWNIPFKVTDYNRISKTKILQLSSLSLSNTDVNNPKPDMQVFPNPFNEQINVNVNINEPTYLLILLYDLSGRKISTIYDGQISCSQLITSKEQQTKALPAGLYILKYTLSGRTDYVRLLKL